MEDEFTRAVRELYFWQFGSNPTNFTSKLYELIGKADMRNAARLQMAFPMEYAAWQAWQNAPDQMIWFKEFLGLPI